MLQFNAVQAERSLIPEPEGFGADGQVRIGRGRLEVSLGRRRRDPRREVGEVLPLRLGTACEALACGASTSERAGFGAGASGALRHTKTGTSNASAAKSAAPDELVGKVMNAFSQSRRRACVHDP